MLGIVRPTRGERCRRASNLGEASPKPPPQLAGAYRAHWRARSLGAKRRVLAEAPRSGGPAQPARRRSPSTPVRRLSLLLRQPSPPPLRPTSAFLNRYTREKGQRRRRDPPSPRLRRDESEDRTAEGPKDRKFHVPRAAPLEATALTRSDISLPNLPDQRTRSRGASRVAGFARDSLTRIFDARHRSPDSGRTMSASI